jgi:hypothetical protein
MTGNPETKNAIRGPTMGTERVNRVAIPIATVVEYAIHANPNAVITT